MGKSFIEAMRQPTPEENFLMVLIYFPFVFENSTQRKAEERKQKLEGLGVGDFCGCMTRQRKKSHGTCRYSQADGCQWMRLLAG